MSSPALPQKSIILTSIALVVVGYFGFSIADMCSKLLQVKGYPIYQVLGISSFVGMLITGKWIFFSRGPKGFRPSKNPYLHLLRACVISGTAYTAVKSLQTLPLADFYGIVFIMPFLVMVLAILVLKEKVGWRRWAAAGVAFSGVLLIAGPQFETLGMGIVFAALAACCGAANIILMRKIGHGEILPLYGFYPFVMMFAISVLMAALSGFDTLVAPAPLDIPIFAIHGPFAVFAIICVSIGFAKAPETSIIAPFHYTQIIWGIVFGWLIFHSTPTSGTWMGLGLVVGAGLYSLWREYTLSKSKPHIVTDALNTEPL